ncbi:MAG: methionine adenosyltransferase [Pontimonas sp.]|jgi:S-adenosylmethionine synthetase
MRYFTSESVTEGHPDKMCDQISDSILDAYLEQDPMSRVAVESLTTMGLVHVAGEVSSNATIDVEKIVRERVREIGYTHDDYGINSETMAVLVSLGHQSPDIAGGVDNSLQAREGNSTDAYDSLGAGDQGLMFGYATNETEAFMPMSLWLAHRFAEKLAQVRKDGTVDYLRPDGKTQVTLGLDGRTPVELNTLVISTQHNPGIGREQIEADLRKAVVEPVMELVDLPYDNTRFLINPSGEFVLGGPQSDAGLTGRKIIVDTYGGAARHGGGAFSGKDPTKVDRSAAYAMRWVAKNVVAAGLADIAEIQVAYAIGSAHPVGIFVETFGTEKVSPDAIEKAISDVFDLRPAAIIEALELRHTRYLPTARYGHFGRMDLDLPWERTNRVSELLSAAG